MWRSSSSRLATVERSTAETTRGGSIANDPRSRATIRRLHSRAKTAAAIVCSSGAVFASDDARSAPTGHTGTGGTSGSGDHAAMEVPATSPLSHGRLRSSVSAFHRDAVRVRVTGSSTASRPCSGARATAFQQGRLLRREMEQHVSGALGRPSALERPADRNAHADIILLHAGGERLAVEAVVSSHGEEKVADDFPPQTAVELHADAPQVLRPGNTASDRAPTVSGSRR